MDKGTYIQLDRMEAKQDRMEHKLDIILEKYDITIDQYGNPTENPNQRIKNKKVTE